MSDHKKDDEKTILSSDYKLRVLIHAPVVAGLLAYGLSVNAFATMAKDCGQPLQYMQRLSCQDSSGATKKANGMISDLDSLMKSIGSSSVMAALSHFNSY